MAEKISVQDPIQIKDSSPAVVAYDLMRFIGDDRSSSNENTDRQYWLTLYHQCYKATMGYSLEVILKKE